MPTTRLTQKGIGGRAYETPQDVELQSAAWGWQSFAITVEYEKPASTRLGPYGVALAAYPPPDTGVIGLDSANWGWTAHPVTVDYQDPQYVDLTTANWGWTGRPLTICSQSDQGYYGSFNDHVWPTCSFNDHVFGPRTHHNLDIGGNSWGWQSFPIAVAVMDPVDVDLTKVDWGWRANSLSVSFAYDLQLQRAIWGWQSFPIRVELPYKVSLIRADWGWRSHSIRVNYGSDIGLDTAVWGWQGHPLDIQAPAFDVFLRNVKYGWQSFPIDVRQTSMLPGDIEAIAEAVYQKLVAEGLTVQVLETWRRMAMDGSAPQTTRHPDNGGQIEVGGVVIEQLENADGDIIQTRQ